MQKRLIITIVMIIAIMLEQKNALVMADQFNEQNTLYIDTKEKDETTCNNIDVTNKIIGHILNTRYNNIPTELWNISTQGAYNFSFINMEEYTYTNYYFHPSANGQLYLWFNQFSTGQSSIKIKLFKVGIMSPQMEWSGNPENLAWMSFNGLEQSSNYYIKFEAYQASLVSGSGYVAHN